MENILDKYICTIPFSYIEVHDNEVFGCCPSWLPVSFGNPENIDNLINNDDRRKVWESILDGSYCYCDKNRCTHLSNLIHHGQSSRIFIRKDKFSLSTYGNFSKRPSIINLCIDRSCNLSCGSCRKDIIVSNIEESKIITEKMNNLLEVFGDSISRLYLSGSGDPFASKSYRDFLINFDSKKYPKINSIHLHTNGLLFDEVMWNKIKNVHKFIKSIEISIDAGTKETYEKVRGGNWNKLIDNLNFIASISTIGEKTFSFVVQDTNFREMCMFHNIISKLPHAQEQYIIYFGKIINWGTYTDDEYLKKQIWNENHIEFNGFLSELKKVNCKYGVISNLNDIIEKYKLKEVRKSLI